MVLNLRGCLIFRPEIAEDFVLSDSQGPTAKGHGAKDRPPNPPKRRGNRGGRDAFRPREGAAMRTKDYKRAAGGDFDEDIELTSLKPEADEGVRLEVQHERGEVVETSRPKQIRVRNECKGLEPLPSNKNWFFVLQRIFREGRSG